VDAIRDVTLSAVVLTRDEEAEIGECLRSLAFCDEIVVVDSGSTDRTVEIAHAAGCRILHHPLVDFAESRNLGLRAARGDWVLFVDADERVSAELQHEIRSRIAGGGAEPPAGFSLLRMEWLCGSWLHHGESLRVPMLRLARRDAGEWHGRVHECWRVSGRVDRLEHPLHHYSHRTLEDFVHRVNRYSTLGAADRYERGVRAHVWHLVAYPAGKFIQDYVVQLGFLDGAMGLAAAGVMSFHSFLIRANLLMLSRNAARDAHAAADDSTRLPAGVVKAENGQGG